MSARIYNIRKLKVGDELTIIFKHIKLDEKSFQEKQEQRLEVNLDEPV